MKPALATTLLCVLYLSQSHDLSVEAFTGHGARLFFAEPSTITTSWGNNQPRAIGRSQTALLRPPVALDLSSKGVHVEDSNPLFVQTLKRPWSYSERELGLLVSFTVPVAWGTYAATVQTVYTLDPQVPGFIFSACYFFVAASGSLVATFWNSAQQKGRNGDESEQTKSIPAMAGLELGFYVYLANFLHVIGLQSVPSDRAGFLIQLTTVVVPMLEAFFARDLLAISGSTWAACALALAGIFVMGMEWPGTEGVLTNALGAEGVDHMSGYVENMVDFSDATSAIEAASMVVDTSVAMAANSDSAQAIVDNPQAVVDSVSLLVNSNLFADILLSGDLLIVCAAFLYAFQIIKISKWSVDYSPLQIMTGKTIAESFLSFLFLGGMVGLASSGIDLSGAGGLLQFLQRSGQQAIDFFNTVSQRLAEGTISPYTIEHFTGACLWTGLVATCYLVLAQSYGQRYVKASDANLIYSLQPLFTALFAYLMLGETLQPMGYVGGALILSGVYLVSTKSINGE